MLEAVICETCRLKTRDGMFTVDGKYYCAFCSLKRYEDAWERHKQQYGLVDKADKPGEVRQATHQVPQPVSEPREAEDQEEGSLPTGQGQNRSGVGSNEEDL